MKLTGRYYLEFEFSTFVTITINYFISTHSAFWMTVYLLYCDIDIFDFLIKKTITEWNTQNPRGPFDLYARTRHCDKSNLYLFLSFDTAEQHLSIMVHVSQGLYHTANQTHRPQLSDVTLHTVFLFIATETVFLSYRKLSSGQPELAVANGTSSSVSNTRMTQLQTHH